MASFNIRSGGIPTSFTYGDTFYIPYANVVVDRILPAGRWKIECWGGAGGDACYASDNVVTTYAGGGGYSTGILTLKKPERFYFRTGGRGVQGTYGASTVHNGGWNGGGNGRNSSSGYGAGGGGGATDIRYHSDDYESRIIVAGGGGGACARQDGRFSYAGGGGGYSGCSAIYSGGSESVGTATYTEVEYYGGPTEYISKYKAANWKMTPTTSSRSSCGATIVGYGRNTSQTALNGKWGVGGSYYSSFTGSQGGGGGGWYGGSAAYDNDADPDNENGGGGSGWTWCAQLASYAPSGYKVPKEFYLDDWNSMAATTLHKWPIAEATVSGSTETTHMGDGYIRLTYLDPNPDSNYLSVNLGGKFKFAFDLNNYDKII